jgi:hypothetical protein
MFIRIVIALLVALFIWQDAQASEETSGTHWLRQCTNPEPALQIECAIYVRALVEYDELRGKTLGQTRYICPTDDLTIGQSREVVIRSLREKPEDLHRPFVLLAHLALSAAFPCQRLR